MLSFSSVQKIYLGSNNRTNSTFYVWVVIIIIIEFYWKYYKCNRRCGAPLVILILLLFVSLSLYRKHKKDYWTWGWKLGFGNVTDMQLNHIGCQKNCCTSTSLSGLTKAMRKISKGTINVHVLDFNLNFNRTIFVLPQL